MSKTKQITKRYVRIVNYYKGVAPKGVNCYLCRCGHITKTVDIDAGATPFLFTCEKCGELATSTFYSDSVPDREPTFEWYRPTLEQVLKIEDEDILFHILSGGLEFRKIDKP